jgi:ubiquinone/menaquinone biosynthesis C-methylase UbiE
VSTDLAEYYKKRAPGYESVYFRPDEGRLLELEDLGKALRDWLRRRDVLEIAAGTGWWTVHAAAVANSLTATDLNQETLAIAKTKPLETVRFEVADAFHLETIEGQFDGCLACFWLSHVSRSHIAEFFSRLHARLKKGSRVFMADNVFEPHVGGQFVEEPGHPDTYRIRTWEDGSVHRVLKNYYSQKEFNDMLPGVRNLEVHMGVYYWWIKYETAGV